MNEYYDSNDEKFGPISSYIYRYFAEPFLKGYYKIIAEEISKYEATKILDIGSGTGKLLKEISKIHNAQLYGIEPSMFMINIASKRLKNEILKSKVRIFQGSSRYIPVNEKFDLIVTTFSFHHWSNKFESIPYIMGFTSEKGSFLIFDYDNDMGRLKNSHGLSEKDFPREILETYVVEFEHMKKSILKVAIKSK